MKAADGIPAVTVRSCFIFPRGPRGPRDTRVTVHRALCPPVPITPVRPSILVALESPRWQRSFRAPGCKPQASVPPQGRQRWGRVTTRHGCQGSWHCKPPQRSLSQRLGWMVHYTGPAGIEPAPLAQNLCCQARQPRVGARIVLPEGGLHWRPCCWSVSYNIKQLCSLCACCCSDLTSH